MPCFTQPVHERPLREFNSCHEPAGRPTGGRFCSKEEAIGKFPEGEWSEERQGVYDAYWAAERAWERKLTLGVSLGKISQKDAELLGWRPPARGHADTYDPLPDTLYHVSTAYNEILHSGLKTRAEIGGVHRGLGGGADDTVSFTTDLRTARAIRSAILEARRAVRGELTPATMLRMAKAQPSQLVANTPRAAYMQSQGPVSAYNMLVGLYAGKTWKEGDEFPASLDNVLRGVVVERPGDSKDPVLQQLYKETPGLGMLPSRRVPAGYKIVHEIQGRDEKFAMYVERPMTEDERRESAFEMYKRFAMAREYAGGRLDPLFFMTDAKALAAVKVKDIKILKFSPRRGARGYQVSALGEWRVHTGRAVKFAGIVEHA